MNKKVFIGVGHGGSDLGTSSKVYKDSYMNIEMALACKEELERHRIEVKMSRIKDEYDPLAEEIKESNEFNPDLAIDIHNNSGGGTSNILAQNIGV